MKIYIKKTKYYIRYYINYYILRLLALVGGMILLASCTTTKQNQQQNTNHEILASKELNSKDTNNSNSNNNYNISKTSKTLKLKTTEKENLFLKARINIDLPQISQSVSATIEIAGTDSILIKIQGPLGISVGKLYANKNSYIMNNNFESTTYSGVPTAANLQRIINLPLDFNDIVYLLRSALPDNTFQNVGAEADGDLYFRKNADNGEFAVINSLGQLTHFQRKTAENELILSSKYSNFIRVADANLAKNIIINFPTANGKVSIEYTDIEAKPKPTSPMSFTKPQSYRLIELE